MPRIEIEVDAILTCAVAVEAEVGDRLLVMNGVIIGLVEGPRPRTKGVAHPVAPAAATPEAAASTAFVRTHQRTAEVRAAMVSLLNKHGPLDARQLVRLTSDMGYDRTSVVSQIKKMRENGRLVPTSKQRFPKYQIPPQGAQPHPEGIAA